MSKTNLLEKLMDAYLVLHELHSQAGADLSLSRGERSEHLELGKVARDIFYDIEAKLHESKQCTERSEEAVCDGSQREEDARTPGKESGEEE